MAVRNGGGGAEGPGKMGWHILRFGGGGSSLHSGIEFGRSRTGEGSSGGRKKGVV